MNLSQTCVIISSSNYFGEQSVSEISKLSTIKNNIDEYRRRQLRLALFNDKSELEFHTYIKGICQRLLGDTIDLDKEQT